MIKPGMFISERYEIIDKVGSGGMADVYKARCHRLNRFVAIKILKSEYSNDKVFVEKFRAEAQSAAGLSHPNIVNVYDVGEDKDLHYIVMELVEGITLKTFVERKGRLSVKEALAISIQIAQGMEAAHENHIIHRDIKPQNIIISKDGKVKVTDFGIAKAATSETINSTAMGSVHYISPERARGGYSDGRGDIYSLGVTMYEMLSGRVPYIGDNNVAVALMHIQNEAEPLHTLVPDIPPVVEHIVERCMQKKPEFRYQSASELIRDLRRAITNTEDDFVRMPENQVTDSPTINISDKELNQIRSSMRTGQAAQQEPDEKKEDPQIEHGQNENRPASVNQRSEKDGQPDDLSKPEDNDEWVEDDEIEPRLKKVMLIVGVSTAVILVIVLIFIALKITGIFHKTTEDPLNVPQESLENHQGDDENSPLPEEDETEENLVPDVQGLDMESAEELLEEKGYEVSVEEQYDDEVQKDHVINQSPAPETEYDQGETVTITVSKGPEEQQDEPQDEKEKITLENLSGMARKDAILWLTGKGLEYSVVEEFDDSVPEGQVIWTSPKANSNMESGDTVVLYVSKGPEVQLSEVPKITGLSEQAAKELLQENNLEPGEVSYVYSSTYEEGTVMGQDVKKGKMVEPGTSVGFTVSKGKKEEVQEDNPPEPQEKVYYYADYYIGYENSPLLDEEEGEITLILTQDGKETELFRKTITGNDFPLTSKIKSTSSSSGKLNMLLNGEDTGFQMSLTFEEE